MLVYCDTNVYCRPLDDQSQPRIRAETEAFLDILQIVQIADELVKQAQIKPKDAFHIASACCGHVRYFLTCDDRVTSKSQSVSKLTKRLGFGVTVLNPLEFLPLVGAGAQNEKGA